MAKEDLSIRELEELVERLMEQLRQSSLNYETQAGGLTDANDQLQAMNDALRSAAEKLEENRNELRSLVEQLRAEVESRKLAEAALRASEEWRRLLIESADDWAIFTIDLERRVNSWNPGAEKMFGYADEEIVGEIGDVLFIPEDQAKGDPAMEVGKALRDGRAGNERWHMRKDGSYFWGSGLVHPMHDDNLRPIGFVKIMRDLTAQRLSDEALRESEEKYRSLFESIDEGFCIMELVTNGDSRIVDLIYREANAAFETNSGISDVIGKRASDLFPHLEQQWLDAIARVHRTGVPERLEGHQADLDRWFTLQYTRVGREGSSLVAVVFNDITERKRREEQQAFLLKHADELRALSDENSIKAQGVKMLAEHMRLDRCWISEVFEEQGYSTVGPEEVREGLPLLEGVYNLSDYPETMRQLATQPMLVRDAANDPRFSVSEKELLDRLRLRSLLVVALRKGKNRVIWALAAAMAEPRDWTEGEQWLLEDVAERLWAAVERVRAEAIRREADERLRLLIESATEYSIFTTDRNGIVNSWNSGSARIYGYADEEIIGRDVAVLFTEEDRRRGEHTREMEGALRNGRALDERWHLRKDGTMFFASGVTQPIGEAVKGS